MATGTHPPSDPLIVAPWREADTAESKSEQYLARRFAAASSEYRSEALVTFFMGLGLGALTWVLAGVLLEHWIVPGGLPRWGRWAWFGAGGFAAVLATIRWGVPPLFRRVNVVYAARAFEREHPELHNDLVNAVLVKDHGQDLPEPVVKTIRRRAARQLSRVPDGLAIHGLASVLAWVMAALVGFACLYQIFAPKSLITSAARLIAPWTQIAAPSRVQIEPPRLSWRMPEEGAAGIDRDDRRLAVVGGAVEFVRGRQLVVASAIEGLNGGEKPVLVVTPLRDDGRSDPAAAAWRMPLVPAGSGRPFVVVPDESRGLDQSVSLVIAAGDARSEPIRVRVVDAPMLLVRELRYQYPAYTGREPETIPWQGDIRGLEGTKVTVVAEANRGLEAAAIDLGCDGRRDVALPLTRPEAVRGSGSFTLRLLPDRSGPEFSAYRFMYRPQVPAGAASESDTVGQLEHRIEVIPDLAPEVAIESPERNVERVPPDAPVTVRVRATDPDFAVASVRVDTRLRGREDVRRGESLLVGQPRQRFRGAATLIPRDLGAGAGSVLEYRAVATDNRPDPPNESATEWRALEIDAAAPPQPSPPPEQPDQRDPQDQPEGGGRQDGGRENDPQQSSESNPSDQGESARNDRRQDEPTPQGDQGGKQEGDQQGEQESQQGAEGGKQGGRPGERQPDQSGQEKPGSQEPGDQQGNQGGGNQQGTQQGEQQGGQAGGQQGEHEGSERGGQQGGRDAAAEGGQQGTEAGGESGADRNAGRDGKQGRDVGERQSDDPRSDGKPEGGEPREPGQDGATPSADEQGRAEANGNKPGGPAGDPPAKPAVAADGTNDGEAMERILENRQRAAGSEQSQPNDDGRDPVPPKNDAGDRDGHEHDQGTCNKDGQPCGKPGCSTCNGGSGLSGSGGGAGQEGAGQEGAGQEGAGQEGATQPGDAEGAADGSVGTGGAAGGGRGEQMGAEPLERREMEWGEQSAEQARNAANLAIEHLRRSLEEGRDDVLHDLGWTREQASAFLNRWEAMQRMAQSEDPGQRGEFDRAVRSLGLRPEGVRRSGDVPTDVRGGQAEGRRTRPPNDYREQFKAFMQGTSVP